MDALSGIASGMAVASLSIQLLDSIAEIRKFSQNVKSAPKDLGRLNGLLARLNSLLDDVRNVIQRQTSLQGQQFPAPSSTILRCLESCEASIQQLSDVVKKHNEGTSIRSSGVARLKEDIHLGLRVKDITGIEEIIQRDIDYLQTALGLNDTNILITMLPLLLQNRRDSAGFYSETCLVDKGSPNTFFAVKEGKTLSTSKSSIHVTWRRHRFPSIFEQLGFRKLTKICSIMDENEAGHVISETREVVVHCRTLGYGLHWVSHYPYGSILPSLQIFPIVESFSDEMIGIFKDGSIHDVQKLFSVGGLHPFTRDRSGWSLLHLGALYKRPDLCQILSSHGLCADLTDLEESPLQIAVKSPMQGRPATDTLRTLLFKFDQVGELSASQGSSWAIDTHDLNAFLWLWINAASVYFGSDLTVLRCALISISVRFFPRGNDDDDAYHAIVKSWCDCLLNSDEWEQYRAGSFNLLPHLFQERHGQDLNCRISRGQSFLKSLALAGLDVENRVNRELESIPGGLLPSTSKGEPGKKIIFTKDDDNELQLTWEWAYDPLEAGHLVVSEYSAFAADNFDGDTWPFFVPNLVSASTSKDGQESKSKTRFSRRMAARFRKQRMQRSNKLPRSSMPGSWN